MHVQAKQGFDLPGSTVLFIFLIIFLCACGPSQLQRQLIAPTSDFDFIKDKEGKFLKVHMKDGGLYMLDTWHELEALDTPFIYGTGKYYDLNRTLVREYDSGLAGNAFKIPFEQIALFESNQTKWVYGRVGAMSLVTVPTAIVTIICLVDPKACFGSCPTFYARKDGQWKLMAEGFSSSIARVFEQRDTDMFYEARDLSPGQYFNLRVTNEALETHAIRYADLLAFPVSGQERIFAGTDGRFYRTSCILHPASSNAAEGDCTAKLSEFDASERFSYADSTDLAKKETVELFFDHVPDGALGLVLSTRQTFISTYFFYQSMAYSGKRAGDYAALVESGNKNLHRLITNLWDMLGGIDIYVHNGDQKWKHAGSLDEMGPIASDVHLVPLPENVKGHLYVKLVMTQGLWRINHINLVQINGEASPYRIRPEMALKSGLPDNSALQLLLDTSRYLVNLPGDEYELKYRLPETEAGFEYFIDTKGYYLEWMRENWLAEEDQLKVLNMFYFPGLYLKKAAPEFKKIELTMETAFWQSRYVR